MTCIAFIEFIYKLPVTVNEGNDKASLTKVRLNHTSTELQLLCLVNLNLKSFYPSFWIKLPILTQELRYKNPGHETGKKNYLHCEYLFFKFLFSSLRQLVFKCTINQQVGLLSATLCN